MWETKATWEFSGTRIGLGALKYVSIQLIGWSEDHLSTKIT
jgi:hypothetical protein